ncbi:bacteriophage protein [Mycobacteroides abscessus subsp. abscessus]|uniref:DNA primase family protein n=1 Tax=Mycobacteroides abscessus TaxID=36809 RepID=UPI00092A606E|nr:phage/plasmid primase, P4 family [Mycobacteroides abscessus]SHR07484.1 bacteriophage protein [Mycobacteroides abscessus subsp. abscessus]
MMSENTSEGAAAVELPGQPLTVEDCAMLLEGGIGAEYLNADPAPLIRSAATSTDLRLFPRPGMDATPWDWVPDPAGILFGWQDVNGVVEWQFRPHNPPVGEDGRARKYLFRKGAAARYAILSSAAGAERAWVVEGTKQSHAVAAVVGETDVVIGIPGCSGWSAGGWTLPMEIATLLTGKVVLIALDADAQTNPAVYDAGVKLADRLSASASVSFVRTPGGGSNGLDDYLATLDVERRAGALAALAKSAKGRPARQRPKAKLRVVHDDERAEGSSGDGESDGGGVQEWMFTEAGKLRPDTIAKHVLAERPVAEGGGQLAVYEGGYYHLHRDAVTALVGDLLRDQYNSGHETNIEKRLLGLCFERKLSLPNRANTALLNCGNGMLDLETGELLEHDPKYLSTRQVAVDWDPDAKCPRYLAWLVDRVGEAQVPVVEEAISQFLNPSRTPSKALFLFGPSRSGKSTMLRLAKEMVGGEDGGHVSAVSLQQLSDDKLAAAELFGKTLNIGADLPKDHIKDLSAFKMLSGDDPITANRKYGAMLTFRNNALFLFSANTIPTVGEESSAYLNRMVPVVFPKTYAGSEDPRIESELLEELPGILVRWVRAYQAYMTRGYAFANVPSRVAEHFGAASDRVARFIAECCVVGVDVPSTRQTDVAPARRTFGPDTVSVTATYPTGTPVNLTQLHAAFGDWVADEKAGSMGRNTFGVRVKALPGVQVVRRADTDYLNVAVKPKEQWTQAGGIEDLIAMVEQPIHPKSPMSQAVSGTFGTFPIETGVRTKLFSATGPLGRR